MNRINKFLFGLLSLLLPAITFADPSITGPIVVMQTDGTQADGAANIITNNAGPIRFYTNKTLRGYIHETTGALTGFTLGSPTLSSPTITGDLTFSDAAASIIGGATSLTLTSGNTVILKTSNDPQRLLKFGGASDTLMSLLFGDSGVTATQTLVIGASTADADDDSTVSITGGGDLSATRGAFLTLYGNEQSNAGAAVLSATTTVFNTSAVTRITLTAGGDLTFDATNGGSIIMPKAATGVILGRSALPSDISATPLFSSSDVSTAVQAVLAQATADANGPYLYFNKTRNTNGSANTVVNNNDFLGKIYFYGADGADYAAGAIIQASVNGTPGSADMPGKLDFLISPDGSATPASVLSLSQDKSALFTGTVRSSATSDIGWSFVDATDNQACNTGCTSACVFGIANATGTAVTALLGCADATADSCICAGSS